MAGRTWIFTLVDVSLCVCVCMHDHWLLSVLQLVKAIEQFGGVVEDQLLKHGKKIVGESAMHCG